jgi:hypothetical protein
MPPHAEPLAIIERLLWSHIFEIAFQKSTTASALQGFFLHDDYLRHSVANAGLPFTFIDISDTLVTDKAAEEQLSISGDTFSCL